MMAALVESSNATCHVRSKSLPSKTHPSTASVEEQLYKFRSSQSPSSPSLSSVCHKLSGLKDLYECVDDLLQLPLTQQSLYHEQQSKWVEEMSDGSVRLLDVCGTTRDVFSQLKECLQELESSLRRRRRGDMGLASEVEAYVTDRKKLNKVVSKCFKNLKGMEKKCSSSTQLDKDSNLVAVVRMLRDADGISLLILESLLCFVSQTIYRSRPNGWSAFSKLFLSKRILSEEVKTTEVERVEAELVALKSNKDINLAQVQNLLKGLEALDSSIQEVVEDLECVYRRLVKTRVSLLNILNH